MHWRLERDVSGFPVRRSHEATQRYRREGYWTDRTLADQAREAVSAEPERVIFIEGGRAHTRLQVWRAALSIAAFFRSRGLVAGDVVSFQLPNWIEASIISLAARISGLVINPIPPIYREVELAHILADCRSKLIFVPATFRNFDHRALAARLRPSLPELRDIVVVRDDAGGFIGWDEAIAFPPDDALPKLDPAAVMMVMYTSGTTSRAKGVLHSHQTYGHKVWQMADVWSITDADVFFMPSPLTHITGAFWSVDMPWAHGSSSVLLDVWAPDVALKLLAQHRCTLTGGATPFLQQYLDVADREPTQAEALRIFFCGGTTVSPEIIRRASARFPSCMFFRSYGCTEAPTSSMGIRTQAQARLGADTDGEIVPPTEVKIVDMDGSAPVADGEEGEILVRGPELFLGYLNAQDGSHFDDDGFFRTGDLGRRVEGDYLVITGRKKDMIIRSGENISPKEVEDILSQHPDIADVAIVAMPSATTGEKGCAFIVPRAGTTPGLPEIRVFLETAGLARQKFPEHVELVDDLPRVPSGKIRKDVLREQAKRIAAGG